MRDQCPVLSFPYIDLMMWLVQLKLFSILYTWFFLINFLKSHRKNASVCQVTALLHNAQASVPPKKTIKTVHNTLFRVTRSAQYDTQLCKVKLCAGCWLGKTFHISITSLHVCQQYLIIKVTLLDLERYDFQCTKILMTTHLYLW